MKWIDFLDNPESVNHIFESTPPLEKVQVIELLYHQDGPRVMIRFDISSFPDKPPEKWILNGYNRVVRKQSRLKYAQHCDVIKGMRRYSSEHRGYISRNREE